ncbi:hypothetical protein MFMK1_000926 [Metallumcola ferriviriculae]|uniref:Uncharacterized protein n=1 Tax=Metallumcola ferriviriculae TaxID=3039180 RepID=A0AAU0UJP1_9FIRM|nr:hypothetical protein MFMK1_000926 [Desulfitibacteraceae bacterium MK1]
MSNERPAWLIDDGMMQNLFRAAGATSYRGTQTTYIAPRILMETDALIVFRGLVPAIVPRKKALIITDKVIRNLAEKVAAVLSAAEMEVKIWDEVIPKPPVESVLVGAEWPGSLNPVF